MKANDAKTPGELLDSEGVRGRLVGVVLSDGSLHVRWDKKMTNLEALAVGAIVQDEAIDQMKRHKQ